jgi:hypothetical protein
VLADAPPRVGRLVQLDGATPHRRPGRLGQPRDPADAAVAQRPGRRAQQQPPLPLGQVRRDQREGRASTSSRSTPRSYFNHPPLAKSPSGGSKRTFWTGLDDTSPARVIDELICHQRRQHGHLDVGSRIGAAQLTTVELAAVS